MAKDAPLQPKQKLKPQLPAVTPMGVIFGADLLIIPKMPDTHTHIYIYIYKENIHHLYNIYIIYECIYISMNNIYIYMNKYVYI